MIGNSCRSAIFIVALGFMSTNIVAADAKTELGAMATKLSQTEQFSMTLTMGYDVVQKTGQKIEFAETRHVMVSRPNGIRMETMQSDGDKGGLVFDGSTITLFNDSENVYSQIEQPGDLDSALRFVVGKLGVRVPLARLLLTTLPADLERLSSEVEFVEHNELGTPPTNHIAGRTTEVDYQVWIASDNLPRRVVITYKKAPGQPQFWANLSDWNLAPQMSRDTFTFVPPSGVEQIPTLLPRRKTDSAGVRGGT